MTTSTETEQERPRGGAETWYEVLDIAPTSSAAEIEAGYQRGLALVEGRSIGGYFLLDPMAVASARADIEAAYAVLKDPARRARYDAELKLPTQIPTPTSTTTPPAPAPASAPPPIVGSEPDEVTANEARELLGLRSTPSGEGVFAPMSPEAKEKVQEKAKEQQEKSQKPKPSLKFLKPVDEKSLEEKQQEKKQTPAPAPAPSVPPSAPVKFEDKTAGVELVPQMTVLPTAAMPPPIAASERAIVDSSKSGPIPANPIVTPMPMPGLFSLEGEVNGQLLKRLREARGLTLDQMVEATKIRKPYLLAIEEQDFENLPARVYLRGFLTQIARVVRVDKVKLAEGYLAFVARYGK